MTRLLRRLFARKRSTRHLAPAPLWAPERLPSLQPLHVRLLEAGKKQPPYDWDGAGILDRCFGPDPVAIDQAVEKVMDRIDQEEAS